MIVGLQGAIFMKQNSAKFFTLFVNLILFTLAFSSCQTKKYNLEQKTLSILKSDGGTVELVAELAVKPEERNYGFMNRKKIPDGTGMLFVFEKDQILSFWMKNTPHPLSIAYISSDGKIVDIFDMTPYSLASIVSSRSVRYALEVPQGWYKKQNINIGDKVLLPKFEI